MKKSRFIYKISLLALVGAGLTSCAFDPEEKDIDPVIETLEVSASADAIVLDEEHLQDEILTFTWTPTRTMSDDYVVSYTTKLDVQGNNFGSTTVIQTIEESGVFSKSFTSEQINNWANERWNVPVNQNFTLEFRVTAQWSGGPTYEMPEVRTVTVNVTPIRVYIFDADRISLAGSAVPYGTEEISKTLENANLYAWSGELTAGQLEIPVELDGESYYICPSDGEGTLQAGVAEAVEMQSDPVAWIIPADGRYRVLIDMEAKTVTIHSPETDLQPLSVTFRPNGADTNPETTIEVTDLWAYGAGTNWGVKKLNCTQSLADPQLLIYSGGELSSGMKFCVAQNFSVEGVDYNQDNAYCFTCPLTEEGKRQNLSLTLDKPGELHGGADGETRNSYYTIPSGTNFILFDLRNGTITASKR